MRTCSMRNRAPQSSVNTDLCFDYEMQPYPKQRWIKYQLYADNDVLVCWYPEPPALHDDIIYVSWWDAALSAVGAPIRGDIRVVLQQYQEYSPPGQYTGGFSLAITMILTENWELVVGYTNYRSETYETESLNPVEWLTFQHTSEAMAFINDWAEGLEE